MSDQCERKIAAAFAPQLYTSPTDGDLTRETYWAAQLSSGGEPNTVMVIYLLGYHRDTGGWPYAHNGDSEWIQLKITYDWNDSRWKLRDATYSAHFMTPNDQTTTYSYGELQYATDPLNGYLYRDYPIVWVSRDKHANYETRENCDNWYSGDDCGDNTAGARVDALFARNIGSRIVHLRDCVTSVDMEHYPGLECFWTYAPGHDGKFAGWLAEGGDTPYVEILRAMAWDVAPW